MNNKGVKLLAAFLMLAVVFSGAVMFNETDAEGDDTPETLIEPVTVYVGASGNDNTGAGTETSPYATIGNALMKCGVTDIVLLSDITTQSVITVDKAVTIDGGDFKITADVTGANTKYTGEWSSGNDKYVISLEAGATLKNVTIDSVGKAFGVNTYNTNKATKVVLDNVTSDNSAGAGFCINGTDTDLKNCSASAYKWAGVNYDKSAKVTVDSLENLGSIYSETYVAGSLTINNAVPSADVVLTGTWTYSGTTSTYAMFSNNIDDAANACNDEKNRLKNITITVGNDQTLSVPFTMQGTGKIVMSEDASITFNGERKNDTSKFWVMNSIETLDIEGGALSITVTGKTSATSGSEYTYGIIAGGALTMKNVAVTINVSSSATDANDIYAFAIKATSGNATLTNVDGTIAGGNRAIQLGSNTLTINGGSVLTLMGQEKAVQAKTATVAVDGKSDVTLELVDPMKGSNTGADDRFGMKVSKLTVGAGSTLTTDGLRVLGDNSSIAGTLEITYNKNGGRAADKESTLTAIPAGLVIYSESTNKNADVQKELKITGNGMVVIDTDNTIVGKITAVKDSKNNSAVFGTKDATTSDLVGIKVTSETTFSVGSLKISGSFTKDKDTGVITITTGEVKISGETDAKIVAGQGAKIIVPSGETLVLNNDIEVKGTNVKIEIVGDVDGTGKITKSGSGSATINATDPASIQSVVDPNADFKITSDETVGKIEIENENIDSNVAKEIEKLFESNTAVYLIVKTESPSSRAAPVSNLTITNGTTLTIPATGTLYLNGYVLKVAEGATLNINGNVKMGAPASATTGVNEDSSTAMIVVEGNLYLDGADVRAPVHVDEDKAYVSIANAKTMKVEGSATSELDVGYGNTLVLTDITIPSGRSINAFGIVEIDGTVTVSKGAQFNVYIGGNANVNGNLVINGTADIYGTAAIDGTVKVVNDNGGAMFSVYSDGKVTVSEGATFTVTKSKANAENILSVDGTFDVEGTLVNTATLKGTINDKGTVTFNGKSDNAQIRLFDGMTITITSVTGTLTITDLGIIDINDYNGNVAVYNGNSVQLMNVKNVTVSEEVDESVKAQDNINIRYFVSTMTVSGVVSAVNENADAYGSVVFINDDNATATKKTGTTVEFKAPTQKKKISVNDLTLGKNVMVDFNGKNVVVSGNVTAIAKTSLVRTTQAVTVTGMITVGPDCGKDGSVQSSTLTVNGVKYTTQDAEANITTYYTSFSNALGQTAYENEYTVLGSITVKTDVEIPADYKVILNKDSTLKIDSAATITVTTDGLLDGAAGTIKVDGVLVINDKDSGLKFNSGADRFVYQVYTENGIVATYTGLLGALENAVSGDVITLKQNAELTEDAVIKEGVTLVVPNKVTLTLKATKNDVKLTVNGKLDIKGEVTSETTSTYKTTIVINGAVANTGVFDTSKFNLKNYVVFSEKVDGNMTEFYSNLTFASETITDGNVTINGDVSAGDIKFVKAEKSTGISIVFANGNNTMTVGSVTLSGASINAENGKVTGTVIAAAAGADARIVLNGVSNITVASTSTPETTGIVDYMMISGTIKGNVVVSEGTVTVNETVTVGTTYEDIMTVSEGVTLVVPKDKTLAVASTQTGEGILSYYGLEVDGTLSIVEGTLTVTGKAVVDGTVTVEKSETSVITGKMVVYGALDIKSTDDDPAKITVNGQMIVGAVPTLGANGTVNGPVFIGTNKAFVAVYTNGDVSAAEFNVSSGVSAAKSTQVYVNGTPFMTIYTNATNTVKISDIKDLVDIEGYEKPADDSWTYENEKVPVTAQVSSYSKIECTVVASNVKLVYSQGVGLVMYIDGLGMENFYDDGYFIKVGTHTVSFAIQNGYDGSNVKITVNGQMIGADGKFTVTTDMDEVTIIVSGAVPAQSSGSSDSSSSDDGMSITDYLLIVLVVLIVIMAVLVAIRMMRS